MRKRPLTDEDGEVRELTEEEILAMHPAAELPPELTEILPKRKLGQRPEDNTEEGKDSGSNS